MSRPRNQAASIKELSSRQWYQSDAYKEVPDASTQSLQAAYNFHANDSPPIPKRRIHRRLKIEKKPIACQLLSDEVRSFGKRYGSNKGPVLAGVRFDVQGKNRMVSRIMKEKLHQSPVLLKSSKVDNQGKLSSNANMDLNIIGVARVSAKSKLQFKNHLIQKLCSESRNEDSFTISLGSKLNKTYVVINKPQTNLQAEQKNSLFSNHMQLLKLKETLLINPSRSLEIILKVILSRTPIVSGAVLGAADAQ